MPAASAWSRWEGDTISIRGPEARPAKFNEQDFATAFARIECHYFKNGGFFPYDGWLLDQVDRIRHIPAWIVQIPASSDRRISSSSSARPTPRPRAAAATYTDPSVTPA